VKDQYDFSKAERGKVLPRKRFTEEPSNTVNDKIMIKCWRPDCGDLTEIPNRPESRGGTFNCEQCGKEFYVNTERTPDGREVFIAEEPR
jgi:hypothetical protein